MKKEDLKTGDLIKTNQDKIYIVFKEENILINIMTGMNLSFYDINDSLKIDSFFIDRVEIEKIYNPSYVGDSIRAIRRYVERREEPNWTWRKKDEYILDKAERRYLRNIIRPFKEKVLCIRKEDRVDLSFIRIKCKENEYIDLPFFKKDKYYKNMIAYKDYTIQDLKLFD